MNGRHRRIRVSVVVPAHNEEGNIEPLMAEFDSTFRNCDFSGEVIFVDDGSTDRTEIRMVEAMRRYHYVKLLKNRTRMGLTASLTRGFAAARGDILVFYPADLQFHPRDIPRMVDAIDNGADMVCGKKVGAYGKWLVSWVYNLLTRALFPRLKVRDMNSVKAFRRAVYEDFPPMREGWHRYLAVFAISRGYHVREVPVTLHKRHSGKSKFRGSGRVIKGLTDLIAVKFQVSIFGDPMHLFGKWSLIFFFVGLLVLAAAVYLRFVEHQGYRPLLYAVILCWLSSLITFIMGIITEALVYLRESLTEMREQNQRLTAQIERLTSHAPRTPSPEKVAREAPSHERGDRRDVRGQQRRRPRFERRDARPPQDSRQTQDTRPPQSPVEQSVPEIKMRELPPSQPTEESRDGTE